MIAARAVDLNMVRPDLKGYLVTNIVATLTTVFQDLMTVAIKTRVCDNLKTEGLLILLSKDNPVILLSCS